MRIFAFVLAFIAFVGTSAAVLSHSEPETAGLFRAAAFAETAAVGTCDGGSNVDVESTGGTALAGYSTLKLAFDAINAGTHTGTVIIEICSSTAEGSTPAVLHSSGAGSANYDELDIYPISGNLTVSGAMPAGRGVIELNGADNVTIDGDDPNSAGTNRNLSVQNTAANTVTYGQVIRIALNTSSVNSANNCTFKNLNIIGNASGRNAAGLTSSSASENVSYGIYLSGGVAGPTSPPNAISSASTTVGSGATASDLVISNNSVTNAGRGIALQGSAQTVLPGLVVENNVVGNPAAGAADGVYSLGITVQGSTGGSIRSNTVYVESYLNSVIRGIDLGAAATSASTLSILGNRVLRVQNNRPQTSGAIGINLGAGSNHLVANNFVAGVRIDQTSGVNTFGTIDGAFGIKVNTGNGHDILHNSVNLFGTVPGNTGSTLTAAFVLSGTNTGMDVRNNVFSNQLSGGNPAGITHASVYLPSGATLAMDAIWNNNAYFQGSDARSRVAQVGATFGSGEYLAADFNPAAITPAANLRSYTRLMNGEDTNDSASFAVAGAPPFASATDLHVSGSTPLESGGANAGVGTDIDGEARNASTPDIGADEFVGAPPNQAPSITSIAPTAATEDVLLTYNATSTDPDGPSTNWSLLPAHTCGGSIVAATGVLTFTIAGPVPPASCTLAIQVCDGGSPSLCASQSATVNITPVNDPPAINTFPPAVVVEDTLYTYNAGFTDPDGTGSSWATVAPDHTCGGSINSSGQFTFTPAGPVPPASCVMAIRVCDGGSTCSAVQTTTLNITAVNDPPVAADDSFNTPHNTQLVVPAASMTSNDSDPDGPAITVTAVSNPVNGTVVLVSGTITFTPSNGFSGPAGFEYTVSDGTLTDTGLVSVLVASPAISGAVNVGAGETITSLTNAGGLFEQLNSSTISGDVLVNITSDLANESGLHALNQLAESGSGNWNIFFQASGGSRLIQGSNATALITLNGADRVSFSGLAFGPDGLVFRNTGSGAVFRFINDASNDSIFACRLEGETSSNNSGVIFVGTGTATGNDNISVSGNTVRDRTDAAGVPVNLIYISGSGGAAANSNISIVNNQLINYTQTGIFAGVADAATISGNVISQTADRSTGLFAIQVVAASGSNNVLQNTITNHSTSSSFVGMNFQDVSGTVYAARNRIMNIENSTGGSVPMNGIQVSGADPAGAVTLENNMVSIVPSTPSSQLITGILSSQSAGSLNVHYNSVLIGGSGTGADTFGFSREVSSANTVSLIGNILFNSRIGAANNFAAGDGSPNAGSWTSNYNIFVGTGGSGDEIFMYGSSVVGLAAWQAGPPSRDANSSASLNGAGPFNVGNMFSAPNDLHLRTIGFNPAINAGTSIGVSLDFDGQTRPFNGTPDIGADEVQITPTAANASISGRASTFSGRGISGVRVIVSGGSLSEPVIATTSSFGYFRIDGLRAGETYVVSISGKRYVFENSVRLVSLGEDALNVDFQGRLR